MKFPHFLKFTLAAVSLHASASIASAQNLLSNTSFETGSFVASNQFVDALNSLALTTPTSGHNGAGNTVNYWGTDSAQWITDSTRATDGNRFLWLAGGATFCAGQELSFGIGQALEGSQQYRFTMDWASVNFNGGNPGDDATLESTGSTGPRLELHWTDSTGAIIGEIRIFESPEFTNQFTGNPSFPQAATTWASLITDPGVVGSGWNRSYIDYTLPSSGIPLGATGVLVSYSNSGLATGSAGLALDNVSMVAIPEPGSTVFLSVALFAPLLRRRRSA